METELVEKAYREGWHEGYATGDAGGSYQAVENDWLGSDAKAAIAAIDESRSVSVEGEAAALVMLANKFNIPPDVQEVLVHGSLSRNIKPGALKSLLAMKPPYGGVE